MHYTPSRSTTAQFSRLEQNGFKYKGSIVYTQSDHKGYVILSTWIHHNLPSVILMDDGKACACFQRISY